VSHSEGESKHGTTFFLNNPNDFAKATPMPKSRYAMLRVYSTVNRVLDEPWTHDFKAVKRKFDLKAGARGENCIWHDGLHPTSAMYKVLAEDMYKVFD
jgi:lysophospholipase L1-like esterase